MTTITEFPLSSGQKQARGNESNGDQSVAELLATQLSEKNAKPVINSQPSRVPPHQKLINSLESIKSLLAKPYIPTLTEKAVPTTAEEAHLAQEPIHEEQLHEQPILRSVPQNPTAKEFAVPQPTERLTQNEVGTLYSAIESDLKEKAQLVLQEVIDDFLPEIEAELNKRLQINLTDSLKDLISHEVHRRTPKG